MRTTLSNVAPAALLACAALIAGATAYSAATAPSAPLHGARLIGIGCDGASGTLYGNDESDFPPCADIRPLGDSWSGVVERRNGATATVLTGASLSDCLSTLDRGTYADESRYPVTYCEREESR